MLHTGHCYGYEFHRAALLVRLLSDRFGALAEKAQGPRSAEAEKLREEVRKRLTGDNK